MKRKANRIAVIMSCVCAIALGVMVIALCCSKKETVQAFTPLPFEINAVSGTPDTPDGIGWDQLDTDVFSVGLSGKVFLDKNKANIWLTNPERNSVWLKLRVLDTDGNMLGETDLIMPGQYVKTVDFHTIPTVGTSVILKVMAYEPETYHSAGSITINTYLY